MSKAKQLTILLAISIVATPMLAVGQGRYYDRPSATECDIIARRASRDAAGFGDGRMARGTVRGAVVGGLLGGERGAKRGAALGAIAAGARRARARSNTYDFIFDDCMRGRLPRY